MDLGKAFLIFILFIFLITGISVLTYDPIAGLIIIFLSVILITMVFEPATGKALLKIFIPVVFLLVILSAIVSSVGKLSYEMTIIITLIVFLFFIGSAAAMGSTEMKSALMLAPLIVIPTFFALLIDPSGRLAIIVASSIMFGFLTLILYLVRNLGEPYDVTMPERFGVAIEDISPKGRVKIGGEIWWAHTEKWNIKKGDEVYVVEREGLELRVVPVVRCPVCGEKYPIINVPERCNKCGTSLAEVLYQEIEKRLKR